MKNYFYALVVLFAFSAGSAMASPSSDYQAGVGAFKRADYSGAITYFKRAEAGGLNKPALYYNLGSAYYKLGDWSAATTAYQKLVSEPKWMALAQYNLGLVAERQGKQQLARQRYRQAYSNARSNKLRRLIAQKLEPVSQASTADPKQWSGFLGAAAGYDDNPVLSSDNEVAGVGQEDDAFAEFMGAASRYISGDASNGWRVELGGYSRLYGDLDDFNFTGVSAGIIKRFQWSVWLVDLGVIADVYYAGGDLFTTAIGGRFTAARNMGEWRLRVSNTLKALDGGDDFEFLSGWQNKSDAQFSRRFSDASQLRIGIRIEFNDRDDLSANGEFQSYSPDRQALYVKHNKYFSQNWELATGFEYRHTAYGDADQEFDGNAQLVSDTRKEDQLSVSALLRRTISANDSVYVETNYTDNDGSLNRYEYDRAQLSIGYERFF